MSVRLGSASTCGRASFDKMVYFFLRDVGARTIVSSLKIILLRRLLIGRYPTEIPLYRSV